MVGLALLLSPLKLLQALHDSAIGQAFLVLDSCHTALLWVNVVPSARVVSILR